MIFSNYFDSAQMNEIRAGLRKKIDVSLYAKEDFNWLQMEEIRLGLEENLDVSIYAKKEFVWFQMKEIREKLLKESTLC